MNQPEPDPQAALDALRLSEAQTREQLVELSLIYELAPVGLCLVGTQLRFVRINERLAAINGAPVHAHLGKTVRDVVPEIADRIEERYRRVLVTGAPILDAEITATLPPRRGQERTFLASDYPVLSETGEVEGIVSVVQDVTERKNVERELEAARFRLAEAQRIAKVGSWEWNLVTDVVWWSEEMERMIGRPDEGGGRSFDDMLELVHPEDRERVKRQLEVTFERDAPYVVQYRMTSGDGSLRRVRATAMLERSADGQPRRLVGTVQDMGGVMTKPRKSLRQKNQRRR